MTQFFSSIFLSLLSLLGNSDTVDLVFVGDAMQHAPQSKAALRANGTYDYSQCFIYLEDDIKSADFAVANLECPLGGKPYTGFPAFSAPDEFAAQLKTSGFDLLLTANNHCLDRRHNGVKRTISVLDSMNIPHIGTYVDADARAKQVPYIVTIKGVKIAMLSYTYGTNGIPVTGNVVVNLIDRRVMHNDIVASRAAGAQVICVNLHWGEEYTLTPLRSQRDLADFLIDEGVDLIIGGHPHVVEPMELRHSDKHNKDVLLVYSLGNFISNQKDIDCRGGAMVKVRVKMEGGKPKVFDPRYKLFFCQKPAGGMNYTLIPEEKGQLIHSSQRGEFDRFMKRAHDLVMSKNKDVPQDTTSGK
ncbi:MAG: CapA family protein [Muribaculaceae bacterium]|nr:CapA family protein [Muribaculaceae bacterium]